MNVKKSLRIITAILSVMLVSTGCGLATPSGVPSQDYISTSVAATMSNQPAETFEPTLTTAPVQATESPTQIPAPASFPLSVAFVAPDRNAYYWNESMPGAFALTTSGDIADAIVSPDGLQVALTRTADWQTYSLDVINADGTNLRTLVTSGGFDMLPRPADSVASVPNQLIWVPGTQNLAMSTGVTFDGPGYVTGESLFLIDTTTSDMRILFNVASQWSWHFFFSPDGSKIAVSYPEGMDIYDNAGVRLAEGVLTYPFINTASEYAWVASPKWSADGSTLVAVVPPQDPWTTPLANSSVYRVSSDGMTSELLFTSQMTYASSHISAITPSLSSLAFLVPAGSPEENRHTLRLANIDGSGMIDYISGKIYRVPDWSTDSSQFFYHEDDSGAWIGKAGSPPLSIPDFNQTRSVTWIDANRFIGASGPEGGWKLLLGSTSAPTGVIFSSSAGDETLHFTVNR